MKTMNVLRPIVPLALVLAASLSSLSGCSLAERVGDMIPSSDRGQPPPKQPSAAEINSIVSAGVDEGRLRIIQGKKLLAAIRPSKPLIEKYGFWNGTEQVVIRCTDAAGTTAFELYNVKGGQLVTSIPSTAVKDGKPAWAAAAQ